MWTECLEGNYFSQLHYSRLDGKDELFFFPCSQTKKEAPERSEHTTHTENLQVYCANIHQGIACWLTKSKTAATPHYCLGSNQCSSMKALNSINKKGWKLSKRFLPIQSASRELTPENLPRSWQTLQKVSVASTIWHLYLGLDYKTQNEVIKDGTTSGSWGGGAIFECLSTFFLSPRKRKQTHQGEGIRLNPFVLF